jgi:hypothetical protein
MENVRQRMIEDMKLRALASRIQGRYLRAIKAPAGYYRRPPGQITEKQTRKYMIGQIGFS